MDNSGDGVDRKLEFVPTRKWVRAFFAGEAVADSRNAHLLRESGRPPIYYLPEEDVRMDLLERESESDPEPGRPVLWTLKVHDRRAERAAISYPNGGPGGLDLGGFILLKWPEMDAWYEEDERVFVHPRDPYHRIDVLRSSRHVKVEIDGRTIAETRRPVLLFETGLPVRFYIPRMDVDRSCLEPSDSHTGCPYKGTASYYSVRVGDRLYEDLVWYYDSPYPEVYGIQDMLCFYNERIEGFTVDGQKHGKGVVESPWA